MILSKKWTILTNIVLCRSIMTEFKVQGLCFVLSFEKKFFYITCKFDFLLRRENCKQENLLLKFKQASLFFLARDLHFIFRKGGMWEIFTSFVYKIEKEKKKKRKKKKRKPQEIQTFKFSRPSQIFYKFT